MTLLENVRKTFACERFFMLRYRYRYRFRLSLV